MKNILLLILVFANTASVLAQNIKRPEGYNYLRGVEAVQNEKTEEALEYFNKDIQENPKSGYSYSWIAMLRAHNEEWGRALSASDLAIKYLPKKDAEYVIFAYSTRANVYLNLEDTVKALADYTTAIRVKPDENDLYEKRAQVYYELGKYDFADADYQKMISLQPGETMGYMGLGRNFNAREQWQEAIKQFDHVTRLASNYSSGYSFRAESYIGLKKWPEATDDIISALSLDWDRKALYLATTLKEPAFTMLVSKMKVQSAKSPNEATWPYIIGTMYEQNKDYRKAIEYYDVANSRDVSPTIHQRKSICYYELGDYVQALNSINEALNIDSTDLSYLARKANIYYEMGNVQTAISEWDKVLTAQPEYGFGYYRRGWFKELAGDFDGAIEDLSMSIVLDPDYSYSYVSRGDVYLKQGKKDLAELDFKKVIEIEDSPEKYDCIHYAYQGLGQYDLAVAAIDSIIARADDRAGSYYDAACLYSRMKVKDKALQHLEKALELGYMRFAHIERDFDMDFIRDTDEYKTLIGRYKTQHEATLSSDIYTPFQGEPITTDLPFTKENGVCKVPCSINGLPLHFVFDTGASDVTISMVEATFMMKNDFLSGADVIGSQKYIDANGNISVGTTINLRTVKFGEFELNNVRASVVRNQKAPLLLGQSVLGRLGKIEIDNGRSVLRITHSK